MELVTFKIPKELIEEVDNLVNKGLFSSRSEAIRYAIGMLITNIPEKRLEIKNGSACQA
ncbi:MAG: ribbon-helix-helix protein, CopG family [Desulfurococcales archaeon]|jgi:Arc/MetJ-type ribon-helix-helix transcriptional regulator|uniref:Ribbon-helix-helix protein, CopG family n=1 Tax=Fervidicoccus fontis TaxID=683846 RepID=A0A7C1IHQ6_9CREN|nr:ribbon-helix-helix protein, CopG family [Desulfurococcales archaeon]